MIRLKSKIKLYIYLTIALVITLNVSLLGIIIKDNTNILGGSINDIILINIASAAILLALIISLYKYLNKAQEQYLQMLKLKKELSYDPLTGLLNKTMLLQELKQSKNAKLILIDIDEFSKINNSFSYDIGDRVLQYVAQKLQDYAKQNNFEAYSIGGDLFALYQDYIDTEDTYLEMVEDIRKIIGDEPFVLEETDTSIILTPSLGLCLENDECFKKASIALKDAKQSNKAFTCYTKKLTDTTDYHRQINTANIVKYALEEGKIVPFYQPIVNQEGKIIKYEALVRIIKKDINGKEIAIPPMEFLQTSVKLKHYADIQKLMIYSVAEKLSKNKDIQIALNMSARDMNDSNINNLIIDIVKKYNIGKNLVIEILENEDISKNNRIMEFLQKIRRLGCKIAIDDFGTGYSNFSYLLQFHPDYLKIDGGLIKDIDINQQNYNIVKLIVAFAKNANMKVVAEHVHSAKIHQMCMDMGIDEFQGYYLGEPKSELVHNIQN